MRLTCIDIGTNTILMLIADVGPNRSIVAVRDEHVIARLGKGVDADRKITPATCDRVLSVLQRYQEISKSLGSEKIIACGTSALRDARNSGEIIAAIKEKVGLEVSVLSGEEEADLTFLGAVSEFSEGDGDRPQAVLDIGGGSTELTIGNSGSVNSRLSISLGSVRLTERILRSSPPSEHSLELAVREVKAQISSFPHLPPGAQLTGVAGTPTTLAAIDLRLGNYDPNLVSGHVLTLRSIERMFDHLRTCDPDQMTRDFPQIEEGRRDVILAGMIILIESMRYLAVENIRVSDRGLRYGIALREHSRQAGNRL
jgi:exopolyphosphatase/guanosine-5'-triphosphate,3'-diphosphate pyrophosphatase